MKTLLRLLVLLILAAHLLPASVSDNKEGRYIEYWERSSYREGFHDGYDGINRNSYEFELDSIAYEIGFIDGEVAFEEKQKTGKPFSCQTVLN
jgi:hypothetical protein